MDINTYSKSEALKKINDEIKELSSRLVKLLRKKTGSPSQRFSDLKQFYERYRELFVDSMDPVMEEVKTFFSELAVEAAKVRETPTDEPVLLWQLEPLTLTIPKPSLTNSQEMIKNIPLKSIKNSITTGTFYKCDPIDPPENVGGIITVTSKQAIDAEMKRSQLVKKAVNDETDTKTYACAFRDGDRIVAVGNTFVVDDPKILSTLQSQQLTIQHGPLTEDRRKHIDDIEFGIVIDGYRRTVAAIYDKAYAKITNFTWFEGCDNLKKYQEKIKEHFYPADKEAKELYKKAAIKYGYTEEDAVKISNIIEIIWNTNNLFCESIGLYSSFVESKNRFHIPWVRKVQIDTLFLAIKNLFKIETITSAVEEADKRAKEIYSDLTTTVVVQKIHVPIYNNLTNANSISLANLPQTVISELTRYARITPLDPPPATPRIYKKNDIVMFEGEYGVVVMDQVGHEAITVYSNLATPVPYKLGDMTTCRRENLTFYKHMSPFQWREGEKVLWKKTDENIPIGSIGTVKGTLSDGDVEVYFSVNRRVRIRYLKRSDGAPLTLKEGDQIVSKYDTTEIPEGMEGKIIKILGTEAIVFFYKPTVFSFPPEQLSRASSSKSFNPFSFRMIRLPGAIYEKTTLPIEKVTHQSTPGIIYTTLLEISPTLLVVKVDEEVSIVEKTYVFPYYVKPHPQSISIGDTVYLKDQLETNIIKSFRGNNIELNTKITVSIDDVLWIKPSGLKHYYYIGEAVYLTDYPSEGGYIVRENIEGAILITDKTKKNIFSVDVSKITRGMPKVLIGGGPTPDAQATPKKFGEVKVHDDTAEKIQNGEPIITDVEESTPIISRIDHRGQNPLVILKGPHSNFAKSVILKEDPDAMETLVSNDALVKEFEEVLRGVFDVEKLTALRKKITDEQFVVERALSVSPNDEGLNGKKKQLTDLSISVDTRITEETKKEKTELEAEISRLRALPTSEELEKYIERLEGERDYLASSALEHLKSRNILIESLKESETNYSRISDELRLAKELGTTEQAKINMLEDQLTQVSLDVERLKEQKDAAEIASLRAAEELAAAQAHTTAVITLSGEAKQEFDKLKKAHDSTIVMSRQQHKREQKLKSELETTKEEHQAEMVKIREEHAAALAELNRQIAIEKDEENAKFLQEKEDMEKLHADQLTAAKDQKKLELTAQHKLELEGLNRTHGFAIAEIEDRHNSEIQLKKQELDSALADISTLTLENSELKQKHGELESELEQIRREIVGLKALNENLYVQIEDTKKKIAAVDKEIATKKLEHAVQLQQISRLKDEMRLNRDADKSKLKEFDKVVDLNGRLSDELQKIYREKDILSQKLIESERSVDKMNRTIDHNKKVVLEFITNTIDMWIDGDAETKSEMMESLRTLFLNESIDSADQMDQLKSQLKELLDLQSGKYANMQAAMDTFRTACVQEIEELKKKHSEEIAKLQNESDEAKKHYDELTLESLAAGTEEESKHKESELYKDAINKLQKYREALLSLAPAEFVPEDGEDLDTSLQRVVEDIRNIGESHQKKQESEIKKLKENITRLTGSTDTTDNDIDELEAELAVLREIRDQRDQDELLWQARLKANAEQRAEDDEDEDYELRTLSNEYEVGIQFINSQIEVVVARLKKKGYEEYVDDKTGAINTKLHKLVALLNKEKKFELEGARAKVIDFIGKFTAYQTDHDTESLIFHSKIEEIIKSAKESLNAGSDVHSTNDKLKRDLNDAYDAEIERITKQSRDKMEEQLNNRRLTELRKHKDNIERVVTSITEQIDRLNRLLDQTSTELKELKGRLKPSPNLWGLKLGSTASPILRPPRRASRYSDTPDRPEEDSSQVQLQSNQPQTSLPGRFFSSKDKVTPPPPESVHANPLQDSVSLDDDEHQPTIVFDQPEQPEQGSALKSRVDALAASRGPPSRPPPRGTSRPIVRPSQGPSVRPSEGNSNTDLLNPKLDKRSKGVGLTPRGWSVGRGGSKKGGTRKKKGSKKNTPLQYGKPSSKRKKIHGSYRQRSQ